MSSSLWAVSVIIALGGGPYSCQTCDSGSSGFMSGGYAMSGGYGGGTGGGIYSTGMGLNSYSGSNRDQLLPWDTQEAWMHGYFQQNSAYPGNHSFRPYNYKTVLSQADLSYRWGNQQGMPYSHQWWHRYQMRASISPALHRQVTQSPNPMTHAVSANDIENARQRAWQEYQAEQRPVSTSWATSAYQYAPSNQTMQSAPIILEPATQATLDYQPSERSYVMPAAPVMNFPRSSKSPMIQEFNPQYAPSGPSLR